LLKEDALRRSDNTVIARALLPVFWDEPQSWTALRHLNLWDMRDTASLPAYFSQWRSVVPQSLSDHIVAIEKRLTNSTIILDAA